MTGNENERVELDCGIAYKRIRLWLDEEISLAREAEAWVYSTEGERCLITIRPLEPRTFGSVSLERTSVVISGDERAVTSFRKLFRLRFVSAGG